MADTAMTLDGGTSIALIGVTPLVSVRGIPAAFFVTFLGVVRAETLRYYATNALSNGSSGNGVSELLRSFFFFFFLPRLEDRTVLVSKAVEVPLPAKKSADERSAKGVDSSGYSYLAAVTFL